MNFLVVLEYTFLNVKVNTHDAQNCLAQLLFKSKLTQLLLQIKKNQSIKAQMHDTHIELYHNTYILPRTFFLFRAHGKPSSNSIRCSS